MKNITKIVLPIALSLFLTSINFGQTTANKAWTPFLKKFSYAVKKKDRAAILEMALPRSSFAATAGGDSAEEMWDTITISQLKSGFKAWNGGKFSRTGCLWFKFIDNRWYWAGTPCD